jgi:uncharacterized membrane protein YbaN (DUF454 family)
MQISKSPIAPFYVVAGFISLGLGVIGAFLPMLPTTPFVLLAGYFFSRSNKRLHNWLLSTKLFGGIIINWEKHQIIPLRAKLLALIGVSIGLYCTFIRTDNWLIRGVFLAICAYGSYFVWSKPSKIPPAKLPGSL